MTMRWQPMAFQTAVITGLAYVDSWMSAGGVGAVLLAAVILAPGLAWSAASPSARAAWWTTSAAMAVLAGCVTLSRVVFSAGPAAPIVDWFAPYAVASTITYLAAMVVSRSAHWTVSLALAPTILITPLWFAVESFAQDEGGPGASPRAVQPLASAWRVTQTQPVQCGQDGALCDSAIEVAHARPEAIQAELRRAGWTSSCRPTTGLLSRVGLIDYGHLCVTVTAVDGDTVRIEILGKTTWWVDGVEGGAQATALMTAGAMTRSCQDMPGPL